jgi:hypothetical protein
MDNPLPPLPMLYLISEEDRDLSGGIPYGMIAHDAHPAVVELVGAFQVCALSARVEIEQALRELVEADRAWNSPSVPNRTMLQQRERLALAWEKTRSLVATKDKA